jgi:hypothetical protein
MRRPVHLIAGTSNRLKPGEPRAAVDAARDGHAVGVSFYNFTGSRLAEWQALASWGVRRASLQKVK